MPSNRRSILGTTGAALLAAAAGDRLAARPAAAAPAYQPQTRTVALVMAPVLTHEFASFLPYLTADFAKGGMFDGKEVFCFIPNQITAYAGDSIAFQIFNPADDPHTLTFPELGPSVAAPAKSTATLTLTGLKAGIYTMMCAESEHMPFMAGQLTVLPAPA